MRVVTQADIAADLPSMLEILSQEAIAIQSDGKTIAFLVSPEQYDAAPAVRPKRLQEAMDRLRATIAESAATEGLNLDELMRSLDRKAS